MITLAVFDMAGTTIDDGGAVYRALELAVTDTGASVAPSDLQVWMGTEKRAAISALIELGGGTASADTVESAYARFGARLRESYLAEPPVPIAGAPEAIAALRAAGVRVGLTTGFSRDIARGILDALGWEVAGLASAASAASTASAASADGALGAERVVVDALVCGDEVAAGRPAPYMIHRVMEATGTLSVAEVLVAGDTAVDVQAGAYAGARESIGVLTGKLGREDFAGEPATAVLASVAEIPGYLAG